MTRVSAAAGLLLAVAALASGCGGSSPKATGLHVLKGFGFTTVSRARVDHVRLANGYPKDLVEAWGHCSCGATYAWVALTPGGQDGGGTAFLPAAEVGNVAAARRASRNLRLFPRFPGLLVRCSIPRAALTARPIAGLCSTGEQRSADTHGRSVEFLEHWPLSKPVGSRSTGGWIVTLGRGGRVLGIRPTGQTPPQLWR